MKSLVLCFATIGFLSWGVRGQSLTAEVTGVVVDSNSEVIPGAKISLHSIENAMERTTTSDAKGGFHFSRVLPGAFEIEVRKEAFKTTKIRLMVGDKAPAALRVILSVADLQDEVIVEDQSGQTNTNPADNLDVIKLDRDSLANLPVLGNDVIAAVAGLVDASSVGTGGATILVDGLEVSNKIPASMIQEVRINQNPYSAEFPRPGRGRIEVITKAGTSEYHGEFGLIFRDSHLDARNAFAASRPSEQRRIFEGTLSGPIGQGKKTSFFFSGNQEEEDLQGIVFARTPSGAISENVATPQRQSEYSFRVNHQFGEKLTLALRLEINQTSGRNGGVGGFNIPEVGINTSGGEHHIFFSLRQTFTPNLVNELTGRIGHEYSRTHSVNAGVAKLIVQDAFTGGGAEADRRTTENHIQFNDFVSWTQGRHFIRTGLNVPDISRRGFSDQTNSGGTFSFATLDDFTQNRPFLFSINRGDGHVAFWQKEFGLFVQDQITLRQNLTIAVGLRYDKQNFLHDNNNLAPRFSVAYSPDKKRKTVFRGGAGVFYDRTGIAPITDTLLYDGQKMLQINIANPGYPNPFLPGVTLAGQPPNVVRFASNLRSPYSFQFNAGIERQLNKSLVLSVNYINTRGIKLFRSRDINAPLPSTTLRPDSTIGVLREIESAAGSKTQMVEFLVRGKISRYFSGTIQYNLGRAYSDTSGITSRPANNYDLSGEWSRADFDERQRLNILGSFKYSQWINLGVVTSLTSGRPYSFTTGRDDNHDSVANDRPTGVRRNSAQGPGQATVDLRWTREFVLSSASKGKKTEEGPAIKIGVAAFNVLNHVNYSGYVGNLSSPFFGLPVAARPARRIQLNLGFSF